MIPSMTTFAEVAALLVMAAGIGFVGSVRHSHRTAAEEAWHPGTGRGLQPVGRAALARPGDGGGVRRYHRSRNRRRTDVPGERMVGLDHPDPPDGLEPRGHAQDTDPACSGGRVLGRIAAASHSPGDTGVLIAVGTDMVPEPFQDAADRAVELLCGAQVEERMKVSEIVTEGRMMA